MKNLLGLTAVVSVVFGAMLTLIPEVTGSLFGVKYDPAGALTARVLGGAWLGYAYLNWRGREAPLVSQRGILGIDLIQDVVGLVATTLGALGGIGTTLIWFWPALFLVFGIAQVYFLWLAPKEMSAPSHA